jgi:cobalt-zinc-cadmium efflux system outer membrane protein
LADLILETKKRFVEMMYIQERLALRKKMVQLAEQFLKKVSKRVEAGRTSPAELSSAEISLLRNRIELEQLRKELSASRQRLGALWGSTSPDFNNAEGEMEISSLLPKLDELESRLSQNVDLLRLSADIGYRKSLVILENASKIPDPSIVGGIRHLNESKSYTFTFNLSLPIPIFNRNQGKVKTAQYLLKKAESKQKAVWVMFVNELKALYEILKTNYDNALTLKTTILPKAVKTFEIITKGYEQGKFNYLNVLDAYRMQLEVREEYLHMLTQFRYHMAYIGRLTGAGIKEYKPKRTQKGGKNEKE